MSPRVSFGIRFLVPAGLPRRRASTARRLPPLAKYALTVPALILLVFLPRLLIAQSSTSAGAQSPWADFVEPDFPFFSSVLDARDLGEDWPSDNLTPRGIILNPGNGVWACFDTELLRMSAVWAGEGVTPVSMAQGSYHVAGYKAPPGQKTLPQIAGTPWLANGIYPGWQSGDAIALLDPREPGPDESEIARGPLPAAAGRFKAVRLTENGALLEYEIEGVRVRERVESNLSGDQPLLQRHFRLDPSPTPLWLLLGQRPQETGSRFTAVLATALGRGKPGAEIMRQPNGLFAVRVHPSEFPIEFSVAMGMTRNVHAWDADTGDGGPAARWPGSVATQGTLSRSPAAYVMDDIELPIENRWRRNIRIADIGFFRDGRAAVVTYDGDVWTISGLKGELRNVRWKRFTSGLHEPLGICVRDEELFVHDRNGIWRLRDTNDSGEADAHELFSNAFTQTAETREFAIGLRALPDGSFVIAKGGQQMSTLGTHNGTVLRISPDGTSAAVLGWGLRQPFIGAHPKTGLVTASDQQGNYVPATPLFVIGDNQFHGFLSNLLPPAQYPAPIADPLSWIPHPVNPSGAGQAWLTGARMGPLNDALIHVGYSRPELFLVLLNERSSRMQGAVLSLTRDFEFAPLHAAVNPADGQLYIGGFLIWGSVANRISGLARFRHTGAPSALPREIVPMDKGVLLRFDGAVDAARALDPANFSAERWNYARTPGYGSPHFKLDGSRGQDAMPPSSAYLSKDGASVFVGIPDMRPVMQMRLGWSLTAGDGTDFEHNAYFTPYELAQFDPVAEGFEELTVDLTPRTLQPEAEAIVSAEEGRRAAELMGCIACHSIDGSILGKTGTTWKGLYMSERLLADGSTVIADEDYLRESIVDPPARMVKGFETSDAGMPSYDGILSPAQIESLILYIKTLDP